MKLINNKADSTHSYYERNITNRVSTQLRFEKTFTNKSVFTFKNSIGYFDRSIKKTDYIFAGKQISSFSELSYLVTKNKSEWVFGGNVWTDNFQQTNTTLYPLDNNLIIGGAFFQNKFKANEKLIIETGIRADGTNQNSFFVLPRISAMYKMTNKITTRIGGGLGYKSPTIFSENAEEKGFKNIQPLNFQKIKSEQEANQIYLQSIVEHMSIGILIFDEGGEVKLINKATKELLRMPHLRHIKALERISLDLLTSLYTLETGESKLVSVTHEEGTLLLTLRATLLQLQGQQLKIISVQNIRSEMEEQELEAWQKLIRVLSHEIMNSITPVVSLASSINDLVAQDLITQTAGGQVTIDEDVMTDVQTGLLTIEKRSEGLLHFVHDYRKLARIPKPNLKPVKLQSLFQQLDALLRTDMVHRDVTFALYLPKEEMEVLADAELISQVLINLIKNAMEACAECEKPLVEVVAYFDPMENNMVKPAK